MKNLIETRTKSVTANIRRVREFKSYTQEYLAAKLEISQNAYSKIELGYTCISVKKLIHISLILNVDVIFLLKEDLSDLITSDYSSSVALA